jgi:Bacterial regulatory helix-turn-helix protein, lysR family
MLDVVKLATLRAILVNGPFSAAADDLNLTQPAVSRQISLLERQVGTPLVRRSQRGVHATETGGFGSPNGSPDLYRKVQVNGTELRAAAPSDRVLRRTGHVDRIGVGGDDHVRGRRRDLLARTGRRSWPPGRRPCPEGRPFRRPVRHS